MPVLWQGWESWGREGTLIGLLGLQRIGRWAEMTERHHKGLVVGAFRYGAMRLQKIGGQSKLSTICEPREGKTDI